MLCYAVYSSVFFLYFVVPSFVNASIIEYFMGIFFSSEKLADPLPYDQIVLMISIDGFRPDYLESDLLPALESLGMLIAYMTSMD